MARTQCKELTYEFDNGEYIVTDNKMNDIYNNILMITNSLMRKSFEKLISTILKINNTVRL